MRKGESKSLVMTEYQLSIKNQVACIQFKAMASPCEILIANCSHALANELAKVGIAEVRRIENKYSRYLKNNYFAKLNASNGTKVEIDDETFALLNYAKQLYEASEGLFDITSGVLEKLWRFASGGHFPEAREIERILPLIGFDKVFFDKNFFSMPPGMQIDFGGVGKEYAVDRVANLLGAECHRRNANLLVNFGGDIMALEFDTRAPDWTVGVESVNQDDRAESMVALRQGGLATSGNTKRVIKIKDKLYGHILNPKTGYPVEGAPRSVTVYADTCTLAGSLSTLAMLQGANAERFLREQSVKYHVLW